MPREFVAPPAAGSPSALPRARQGTVHRRALPATTDYGYVNRSALVVGVVPPAVVTEILTVPAAWAGAVAMIEVGDETV